MTDKQKEKERIVKLTLIRIGINCENSGFNYLYHSILEVIDNPKLLHDFKTLTTIVAKKCEIENPFRVEANMHNSIVFAYKRHGFKFINTLFGMNVIRENHRPTTAEIIKLVAEYYNLELYKNKFEYKEPNQINNEEIN